MQPQNDRRPWNVRALLEWTATPFAIADYGPRAAIFLQGDPCDSVMHIERGRVWLAVTTRSGKEAICGLLGTGAFLGEEALVGRGERRQSATDQIFHSSEQRLAHTLLVLANCDEWRPRRCALPDLPQEIIAEMVGTTRSRVNASMGKFKKLGFIEENSGVLHVNPARLHVVSDGDRRSSIAASPAIPQAPESEERHWPLAG
jgi:CRP/FNR family transcriptional regulator, cyclic AMP receptor protein